MPWLSCLARYHNACALHTLAKQNRLNGRQGSSHGAGRPVVVEVQQNSTETAISVGGVSRSSGGMFLGEEPVLLRYCTISVDRRLELHVIVGMLS